VQLLTHCAAGCFSCLRRGMRDPTRAVPVAEDARPEDRQFTQEPRPNPSSQP